LAESRSGVPVPTYAAIDFGASSGRVLAGRFDGERVTLTEAARFPNRPVDLPDGRHWDRRSRACTPSAGPTRSA
jgi:hypothetical protein